MNRMRMHFVSNSRGCMFVSSLVLVALGDTIDICTLHMILYEFMKLYDVNGLGEN